MDLEDDASAIESDATGMRTPQVPGRCLPGALSETLLDWQVVVTLDADFEP